MKSPLSFWISLLLAGAISLWSPNYILIPLVGFVLIRILFEVCKGPGRCSRDRFRDSLRTAERILEDII